MTTKPEPEKRGSCLWCGQHIPLRKDGTMLPHWSIPSAEHRCRGADTRDWKEPNDDTR